LVFGKARVYCDILKALELQIKNGRDACDRLRVQHTPSNDPKAARALSDQHVAIGQKRQRKRPRQTLRRHNTNFCPALTKKICGRWQRVTGGVTRIRRLLSPPGGLRTR